ncbi:hypothetical protein CG435_10790 [Pantoea ananatis]|uniref:hypothetical protein n=1 Tax=Pantoea ananas TaxID=553 RepID=UPI000CF459BB|nr:hypothetical protein [Pantoea ananatis]MDF7789583.1 hypothetical protein [Pantoea ananatis]PQK99584.1 hypothetical protein CG435_10790 [Pantoea ananatis]
MADTDNTQAAPTAVASAPVSKTEAPGFILVVRIAFADYQIGEEITDAATIREILGGDQAVYVIKRAA